MNWLVDADVTEPVIVSQVVVSASTGDTQFDISIRGQRYRVHKWVRPNNVFNLPDYVVGTIAFSTGGEIEVFCVGGGGRGGLVPTTGSLGSFGSYASGGGGGGGAVVQSKITVSPGNFAIAVGWGGSSSLTNGAYQSSIFGMFNDLGNQVTIKVRASGGGNGGNVDITSSPPVTDANDFISGFDYASGGGGGALNSNTLGDYASNGGNSILGQGNIGADGVLVSAIVSGNPLSGGGGGAGDPGQIATNALPNGGNGVVSSITGTPVFYGGGGAGGCRQISPLLIDVEPALGGLGGGGSNITGSENGAHGFGGGGAGGIVGQTSFGLTKPFEPGDGGTGVVIIRYPIGV